MGLNQSRQESQKSVKPHRIVEEFPVAKTRSDINVESYGAFTQCKLSFPNCPAISVQITKGNMTRKTSHKKRKQPVKF